MIQKIYFSILLIICLFCTSAMAMTELDVYFAEAYSKIKLGKLSIKVEENNPKTVSYQLKGVGAVSIKSTFRKVTINNSASAVWFEIVVSNPRDELVNLTGVLPETVSNNLNLGTYFTSTQNKEKFLISISPK